MGLTTSVLAGAILCELPARSLLPQNGQNGGRRKINVFYSVIFNSVKRLDKSISLTRQNMVDVQYSKFELFRILAQLIRYQNILS